MLPMVGQWLVLQEVQVFDPTELEYLPMPQGVQLVAEGAATWDEEVPAWQGTQLIPEGEKVPGLQRVQVPFWEYSRPVPQPFGFKAVHVSPNQQQKERQKSLNCHSHQG